MTGDPNIEMFSKQTDREKIYNATSPAECTKEGAFQFRERSSYEQASLFSQMYSEYDLLEQVGIWELYEATHTSSETLVEIGNLKAHK